MLISPLIELGPGNPVKPVTVKLDTGNPELASMQMYVSSRNELIGVSDPKLLRQWLDKHTAAQVEQTKVLNAGNVPDATKRDIRFFSGAPCWFEGCEEIRADYESELAKLDEAKCKPCEKGALIRKYLKILAEKQS
jgi:hypothetical protein